LAAVETKLGLLAGNIITNIYFEFWLTPHNPDYPNGGRGYGYVLYCANEAAAQTASDGINGLRASLPNQIFINKVGAVVTVRVEPIESPPVWVTNPPASGAEMKALLESLGYDSNDAGIAEFEEELGVPAGSIVDALDFRFLNGAYNYGYVLYCANETATQAVYDSSNELCTEQEQYEPWWQFSVKKVGNIVIMKFNLLNEMLEELL
jgi:hypothetical protein